MSETNSKSFVNYQNLETEVKEYLQQGKSHAEIVTILLQAEDKDSWEKRVLLIGHVSKEEKSLLNVAIDGALSNKSYQETLKSLEKKGVDLPKGILLISAAEYLKKSSASQLGEIKKERKKITWTAIKYTIGGAIALAAGGIGGFMAIGGGYIVYGLFSIALIGLIYLGMGLFLLGTLLWSNIKSK